MAARMRYPEIAPEGYAALSAFGHYVNTASSLGAVLLGMVYLRASQLNGCEFCIALHRAELQKHHEPDSRTDAVADWRGSEAFTPREQAALRWTEVLTKLTGSPVPDEEYQAVSVFFQGKDLVDLSFAVANINAWNRMGLAFQPEWRPRGRGNVRHEVETTGRPQPAPEAPEVRDAVDDDGGKVATN